MPVIAIVCLACLAIWTAAPEGSWIRAVTLIPGGIGFLLILYVVTVGVFTRGRGLK